MESKSIRKESNENSNSNKSEGNISHQQTNLDMECHASNSKRRGSVTIMECYIYIIALGIKSNHTALFIWADAYTVAILHRHRSKARSASIRNVVSLPSSSLTAAEAFVLGAISKMVATEATYPLQLAQVLLRLQSKNDIGLLLTSQTRTLSIK
jgi:hypothetical protein